MSSDREIGGTLIRMEIPRIVQKTRFLENLRILLSAILVFHHSRIYVPNFPSPTYSKSNLGSTAMFFLNFLHWTYFFVSGYSIRLALETKSESAVFVSRTLQTVVPALLYDVFGQPLLSSILQLIGTDVVLGPGRVEGSGPYVFALMFVDYAYLIGGWVRRKWPIRSARRLESRKIEEVKRWVIAIFVLSSTALAAWITKTFLSFIPYIHEMETPGFGVSNAYVAAYVAGDILPLVNERIRMSHPAKVVAVFVMAQSVAHLFFGVLRAQGEDHSFIYTVLFTFWIPFGLYVLTMAHTYFTLRPMIVST